jgi:NAD(P)-dependent dehydrogenase (short-subunit alcohol dehydrogenase family)
LPSRREEPAIPDTTDPDIDTCLRVLAQAGAADPAEPRWALVHQAVGQVYRAGKKTRKTARHAERRQRDREVIAGAARYRQQEPLPIPENPSSARPDAGALVAPGRTLLGAQRCYVCKAGYRSVHPDYHLLCPDCARREVSHRDARCDLRGRRAIVTGGRVKIGFHVTLKLLRDGAEVMIVTRFPRDAARRFAGQPDAADWLGRLHVHGADLLDMAALADLLGMVSERFGSLDILINNAAQTIRRPAEYYRHVRAGESLPLTGAAARIEVTGSGAPSRPGSVAPELTAPVGPQLPVPAGAALPGPAAADARPDALFPAGRTDETGQPLDLRARNSWSLRLHEVEPAEWLEAHMVNAFAPFLLTSRLRGLLEASLWPDRYIVQVSAMEGSFSRATKTVRHPHTNMAKASLNMLTRTAAADYAASGIYMNSVDTGWVTDERPHPDKTVQRAAGFRPPLDAIDGAARVYDPIVRGVGGERVYGVFFKDYRPADW